MASKAQLTGMRGVYLVAAELSRRGFIASPTSRSAVGADILVTDQRSQRSYSVQVKTNSRTFQFWLLGAKCQETVSDTHVYALVNLRQKGGTDETEYFIVPSAVVAERMLVSPPSKTRGTVWYSIYRSKIEEYRDRWTLFDR